MKTDFDVIIAGSGPGGSTCAFHLASAGADVLVIEKKEHPRDKPCAGGIPGVLFHEPNIREFKPHAGEITRYRFTSRGENPASGSLPREGIFWVDRAAFDYHLFLMARNAGAGVLQNTPFSDYAIHKDHLEVTAGDYQLRCRYLAGADGGFSRVARKIHPKKRPMGICGYYRVPFQADSAVSNRDMVHLDFNFIDGGVAGVIPKGDHLWVGAYTAQRCNLGELEMATDEFISLLGLPVATEKFTGLRIPLYDDRIPLHRGRVLLIGEAGGLVNPISGEGIKPAVDSGHIAAEELIQLLSGKAGNFAPYEQKVRQMIGREMKMAGLFSVLAYAFPGMAYHGMTRVVDDAVRIMNGQLSYGDFLRRLKGKIAGKIRRGLVHKD